MKDTIINSGTLRSSISKHDLMSVAIVWNEPHPPRLPVLECGHRSRTKICFNKRDHRIALKIIKRFLDNKANTW